MRENKRKKLAAAILTAATVFLVLVTASATAWFFISTQTDKVEKVDAKSTAVVQKPTTTKPSKTRQKTPSKKNVRKFEYRESTGVLKEVEPDISSPTSRQDTAPNQRTSPKKSTFILSNVSVSESEFREAARKNALRSPTIEAKHFMGLFTKESGKGDDVGQANRMFSVFSANGYAMLKHYSNALGTDRQNFLLSEMGAAGLTQALLGMIATHCGASIDFNNTPKILLHKTAEYASMTRTDRIAGIKLLQRKLGVPADGFLGSETLARIREVTGEKIKSEKDFLGNRAAKYKLIHRFFDDEITVTLNPKEDDVFKRICLVEGKDPRTTEYFLFNPWNWNPIHAAAYSAVHIESDMQRAGKGIRFGLAAYYCGYGKAKAGNILGVRYRDDVLSIAERYEGIV